MYNEAIIFDIPPENVEQVSLSIAVMDYDRCVSALAEGQRARPRQQGPSQQL